MSLTTAIVTATPMRQNVRKLITFLFLRCWTRVNDSFCIGFGNELATMRPRMEDRKTRRTAVETSVNKMVGQLPADLHLFFALKIFIFFL